MRIGVFCTYENPQQDFGLCRKFLSRVGMGYDRRQQSRRNNAMIDFEGSR